MADYEFSQSDEPIDLTIIDALRRKPTTPEGAKLARHIARITDSGIFPDVAAQAVLGIVAQPPSAVIYPDGTTDVFPSHDAFDAASTEVDERIQQRGGIADIFDTES